ncbi:MAG: type I methionyl aminopeptidase [Bacteroidetes bacterium]|nr:type I methionyl aminopeptidase [Bacteroidota bacterium]PHX83129.1 MAG: type I methionyl aminopeptidase [Flavobacteriales bacterium]
MIRYKTKEEIELIRISSLLVGKTLAVVASEIKPGVSTAAIDKIAETFILDNGAKPAFKNYRGFPGTLCVSPNAQVVHGMPGKYILQDGDIISVDCGVLMNGFYGDSAYTFPVGNVKPEILRLLRVTKESLYKGLEKAIVGGRIGDISEAVQFHAESNGFSIVRELVGHGVGKNLHEDPEVANYGRKGTGPKLAEGLVIAIEPMVNFGKRTIRQEKDGWTITTADGLPSAHFEHTIAVGMNKPDILSSFDEIEKVLNGN